MMPKHVAKGLPKGLTDRMPGKASAARLATAMTTALTTAAAVLCIKGRRNKERERNGKQKTDMAIHSRPPANQESTPTGCRLAVGSWLQVIRSKQSCLIRGILPVVGNDLAIFDVQIRNLARKLQLLAIL